MIQRIQTLWLLAASVAGFCTLKLSFFSGNILVNNLKQFQRFTALSHLLLTIFTVVVAAGALVTIFLYKDRKKQFRIGAALMILSIVNLIINYTQTKNYVPTEWTFDFTALLSLAIPFFLFLAMRGIYKDDKLIKSADRLR
jgi:heme A synthase